MCAVQVREYVYVWKPCLLAYCFGRAGGSSVLWEQRRGLRSIASPLGCLSGWARRVHACLHAYAEWVLLSESAAQPPGLRRLRRNDRLKPIHGAMPAPKRRQPCLPQRLAYRCDRSGRHNRSHLNYGVRRFRKSSQPINFAMGPKLHVEDYRCAVSFRSSPATGFL
jgi:hypothetical protein